jgi:hypothetical protein
LLTALACEKEPPYDGTPPSELIEFTVDREENQIATLVINDSATKNDIYELGMWLLRYDDVDVFHWIENSQMTKALVTRRVDGVGTDLEKTNNWTVCNDLGYVVWYANGYPYPVESMNTDGHTEMYRISSIGQYRNAGVPLDDRCDYQ